MYNDCIALQPGVRRFEDAGSPASARSRWFASFEPHARWRSDEPFPYGGDHAGTVRARNPRRGDHEAVMTLLPDVLEGVSQLRRAQEVLQESVEDMRHAAGNGPQCVAAGSMTEDLA